MNSCSEVPVRGAEPGRRRGGQQGTIAQCAPVKFLSGREEGRDIFRECMMGQTDCIYLLSHCVCIPFLCRLPSDPSCLGLCLHCGCAELTFLLWCSSFCVDIHINYPDCQEHLSGVTTLLSAASLSLCVSLLMTSSELEKNIREVCFTQFVTHQD